MRKMASNVKTSQDPKSVATSANNANEPGKEAGASSTSAQTAEKASEAKSRKVATDGDKKKVGAKAKNGKKKSTAFDDSSSRSSDGLESVSSSSNSGVSGSGDDTSSEENAVKKKRVLKKKQAGQREKSKGKSAKKSRKHPKSRIQRAASETEDGSGAGSSDDSNSDSHEEGEVPDRNPSEPATQAQLFQLYVQLHLLQQQLQQQALRQSAGFGIGGGAAALGPAGVGMVSVGGAGPGGNAPAMGNIAANGSVGGTINPPMQRFMEPDLGNAGGMIGRAHAPPARQPVVFEPPPSGRAKGQGRSGRNSKPPQLEFKRVDQVWDSKIHNYRLQDTARNTSSSQYSEFIFHVRRTFDWEGKYKTTVVDIKSKPLREALQAVMGAIKGVGLVEETPKLDPNMLFL